VVRDYTTPVCDLIEAIAPELELQVEKKEISDPKSAKELLPGSALGLLPRPPVFTRRSMRNNPIWFLASESSLMCSLVNGPSGVWDREDSRRARRKKIQHPKNLREALPGKGKVQKAAAKDKVIVLGALADHGEAHQRKKMGLNAKIHRRHPSHLRIQLLL